MSLKGFLSPPFDPSFSFKDELMKFASLLWTIFIASFNRGWIVGITHIVCGLNNPSIIVAFISMLVTIHLPRMELSLSVGRGFGLLVWIFKILASLCGHYMAGDCIRMLFPAIQDTTHVPNLNNGNLHLFVISIVIMFLYAYTKRNIYVAAITELMIQIFYIPQAHRYAFTDIGTIMTSFAMYGKGNSDTFMYGHITITGIIAVGFMIQMLGVGIIKDKNK